MKVFLLLSVIFGVLISVFGIVFTRCELADELLKQGFPENLLNHWVCMIESESGGNSTYVKEKRKNGWNWGLFQINDQDWCRRDRVGRDCKIQCQDLATDNITLAAICAKKVFRKHGFRNWPGWRRKCQGTPPDISPCFNK